MSEEKMDDLARRCVLAIKRIDKSGRCRVGDAVAWKWRLWFSIACLTRKAQ